MNSEINQKKEKKLKAKQVFWEKHIIAWSKSGLNKKEYCKKKQICYRQFYRWKKEMGKNKLADKKITNKFVDKFVAISVKEAENNKTNNETRDKNSFEYQKKIDFSIELKQGHKINVYNLADLKELARIIHNPHESSTVCNF